MKLIAPYDLTHSGSFVKKGDQFQVCAADGVGLMNEGFEKPTTTKKATKPAVGGGES